MKKSIYSTLLTAAILCPSFLSAQEGKSAQQVKMETYQEYSHWTVGVNVGIPFTGGDMTSFSDEKTYLGFIGGLQFGYQFNPIFGISLTGDYGFNKAGSKSWENNFVLAPNGSTVLGISTLNPVLPAGDQFFKDLYTLERYFMAGLHFDVNLVNLFSRTKSANRRWAIILSPAVYGQKFSPEVKLKSNDERFANKLTNNINLALGGDLVFRYRASKHLDVQLKCTGNWIDNQKFDGIINTASYQKDDHKYNWMAAAQIGVVWKIGNKNKKDNILWAPTKFDALVPVTPPAPATPAPVEEPVVVEEVVEVIEETPVLPAMPAIHFVRNSSKINTTKYASELAQILTVLKENPEIPVQIQGWADRTGTTPINDKISKARAEALRNYLVENGIPASRIVKVEGMGVDTQLPGEEGYSVKARFAIVLQYGE